jgi:hypothetical protein
MDETIVPNPDVPAETTERSSELAHVSSAPPAERSPADEPADARGELLRLASALRQARDPRLLALFLKLRRRPHGV